MDLNTEATFRNAELVQSCNTVLACAGLVATVRTVKDVQAVCSSTSIFVATYEALVGRRLEGTQLS
eukprot:6700638-Pyramimonas_sp.AAC.1